MSAEKPGISVLLDTENVFRWRLNPPPASLAADIDAQAFSQSRTMPEQIIAARDDLDALVEWIDARYHRTVSRSFGKDVDSLIASLHEALEAHGFTRLASGRGKNLADFALAGELFQRLQKKDNSRFLVGSRDFWVQRAAALAYDGLEEAHREEPAERATPEVFVLIGYDTYTSRQNFAAGAPLGTLQRITMFEIARRRRRAARSSALGRIALSAPALPAPVVALLDARSDTAERSADALAEILRELGPLTADRGVLSQLVQRFFDPDPVDDTVVWSAKQTLLPPHPYDRDA